MERKCSLRQGSLSRVSSKSNTFLPHPCNILQTTTYHQAVTERGCSRGFHQTEQCVALYLTAWMEKSSSGAQEQQGGSLGGGKKKSPFSSFTTTAQTCCYTLKCHISPSFSLFFYAFKVIFAYYSFKPQRGFFIPTSPSHLLLLLLMCVSICIISLCG